MPAQTFRKIPVEIQAVQLTRDNVAEVEEFIHGKAEARKLTGPGRGLHDGVIIHTLEGDMRASWGDWIIRGVKGEHYPCKPDIFAQTYSLVQDDGTVPETNDEPLTEPCDYADRYSVAEIDNRFTYHPPTPAKVTAHENTRGAVRAVAHLFDQTLPPGREKSLAQTKLEEATFWANAAIARQQ